MMDRLRACPCGSGLRYKACCGLIGAPAAESVSALEAALRRDDLDAVLRQIAALEPETLGVGADALAVGRIALRLGLYARARPLLERALALGTGEEARLHLCACWQQILAPVANASRWRTARALRGDLNARAQSTTTARTPARVHIIGDLRDGRRDRTVATALHELLRAHREVRLWSVQPGASPGNSIDAAVAASFAGDTVVMLEADDPPGDWFDALAARRLVLRMRSVDPRPLLRRLAQIEACGATLRVAVTLPGRDALAHCGDDATVEFPWVDMARVGPTPSPSEGRGLTVGRHGASPPTEHHPADPALYRQLLARGHRLRILGGEPLTALFAGAAASQQVALLPARAEDAPTFLATLDVYLYRRGPRGQPDGDARVLDAMGAARPVIVFADSLAAPELVESGHNGMVVRSNEEALACIERLAAEPGWRQAMGEAARTSVQQLMAAQRERALGFYLN